jgi:hypothetical protein
MMMELWTPQGKDNDCILKLRVEASAVFVRKNTSFQQVQLRGAALSCNKFDRARERVAVVPVLVVSYNAPSVLHLMKTDPWTGVTVSVRPTSTFLFPAHLLCAVCLLITMAGRVISEKHAKTILCVSRA